MTSKPKTPPKPKSNARARRGEGPVFRERGILRLDDARFEQLRLASFLEGRPMTHIIRDALDVYHEAQAQLAQKASKKAARAG